MLSWNERADATTVARAPCRGESCPCPPNVPLQPRRLMIRTAAVGCKRMFGSSHWLQFLQQRSTPGCGPCQLVLEIFKIPDER